MNIIKTSEGYYTYSECSFLKFLLVQWGWCSSIKNHKHMKGNYIALIILVTLLLLFILTIFNHLTSPCLYICILVQIPQPMVYFLKMFTNPQYYPMMVTTCMHKCIRPFNVVDLNILLKA